MRDLKPDEAIEFWEILEDRWWIVAESIDKEVEDSRTRLEQHGQVKTTEELAFLQGRIDGLRMMNNLPKRRIAELKQQEAKHGRRSK